MQVEREYLAQAVNLVLIGSRVRSPLGLGQKFPCIMHHFLGCTSWVEERASWPVADSSNQPELADAQFLGRWRPSASCLAIAELASSRLAGCSCCSPSVVAAKIYYLPDSCALLVIVLSFSLLWFFCTFSCFA